MKFCMDTYLENRKKKGVLLLVILLFIVVIALLSLCIGVVRISPYDIVMAVKGERTLETDILVNVRMPRMMASFAVGMALSAAGLIIQNVLNNPLAGPNILGINTGAGLGFIISVLIFNGCREAGFIMSFMGAVVTTYIVLYVAGKLGSSRRIVILTGVAINSILNAVIDGIAQWFPDSIGIHQSFKIGSFQGMTFEKIIVPIVLICIIILLLMRSYIEMDILKLGDELAVSLGIRIKRLKAVLIISAAVLVGLSVSMCGILSFVGLIVPHIARGLFGEEGKLLIPACTLIGGGFTVLCDLISRTIFSPYDIPVGIVISIIGGMFFLWLLFSSRRKSDD